MADSSTPSDGSQQFEQHESNPYHSPAPVADERQSHAQAINPWIDAWTKPATVVREMLATTPSRFVLLLAILGSASRYVTLAWYELQSPPFDRFFIVFFMLGAGAVAGSIGLYLLGWLYGLAGRSLGGTARAMECRTALAWSQIPSVWMLLPFLGVALYFAWQGPEILVVIRDDASGESYLGFPKWFRLVLSLPIIIQVWQLVLLSQSLGEVHGFTTLKGLVTIALSGVAMAGIILVVVTIWFLITAPAV